MKKLLLVAVLATLVTPAEARVEAYEAMGNVVEVMTCVEAGKTKIEALFHNGPRYNQWTKIRDMRQVSAMEFEFLVANNYNDNFSWYRADTFSQIRCEGDK